MPERDDTPRGVPACDLGSLAPARLAGDGDFKALAARVTAGDSESMSTLAAHSQVADAFRWAWAFLQSDARGQDHWPAFAKGLTEGVVVPVDLQPAIREFLTRNFAGKRRPGERPSTLEVGQQRLLASLADGFAQDVAAEVFEESPSQLLLDAALQVLGRSRNADHRQLVVAAGTAEGRPSLETLSLLEPPLDEQEADAVAGAILSQLSQPLPAQAIRPLQTLLGRLPSRAVVTLLRKADNQHRARHQLLDKPILTAVPLNVIREVLAAKPTLPDELAQAVVQQQAQRIGRAPNEEAAEFAVWLHGEYPAEWTSAIRRALLQDIGSERRMPRSIRHEERQTRAGELLRRFLEVNSDVDVANAYALALRPGDLSVPSPVASEIATRYGHAAGHLLRQETDAYTDDVVGAIEECASQHPTAAGTFVAGLVATADRFPNPLPAAALAAGGPAIAAAAAAGHQVRLVEAALDAATPDAAADLVRHAAAHIDHEHIAGLLERASWSHLPNRYPELIDVLAEESPDCLQGELVRATGSLADDRDPIDDDLYAHLLSAALRTGQAEPEDLDAPGCIQRLLIHRNGHLRELALEWARHVEPTDRVVTIVVEAAETVTGMADAFASNRAAISHHLASRAKDTNREMPQRLNALCLAAQADPAIGRAAAFTLAEHRDGELRLQAAQILASTPPQDGDEERLLKLLDEEPHKDVQEHLQQAVHRITSASIDDALRRLAEDFNVGIKVDVDVLLPDTAWHDAAATAIDRVRRNKHGGTKEAFINDLVSLGDLLIEQYLVRMTDLEGKRWLKPDEADLLRSSAPGKPDIGEVLRRQSINQNVPWFAHHLSLREHRTAHATPRGSTTPLQVGDEARTAAGHLFSKILQAWADAMHAAAGSVRQ